MKDSAHNLFYVPPDNIHGNSLVITGEEYHHLKNVLRKKRDDLLTLTDGQGHRFEGRISALTNQDIVVEVIKKETIAYSQPLALDLAFGPLKGTRTDLIVEKGTELGVRRFILFMARHSVVDSLTEGKLQRYQKIARSAMLQSRQCHLPDFVFKADTVDLMGLFPSYDAVLVADPAGSPSVQMDAKTLLFIVGPEGGFSEQETDSFKKAGIRALSLGSVRLRSETAVLAGIVKILSAYKII
jgi:16S rRNA (uracil1498-N3)-methyltransferase